MAECILNLLPLTDSQRAEFEAAAPHSRHIYSSPETVTPEELAQADIIFGAAEPSFLRHATNLKWLQNMWVGVDKFLAPDILPPQHGILLTGTAGAFGDLIAEHLLAMLFSLCKHLPLYRDRQNAAFWNPLGSVRCISDLTVLLLGCGDIGQNFARMVHALGAHTIGLKRCPPASLNGVDELFPFSELDSQLPRADVVALSLPFTPETDHILNRHRIGLLRQGAIVLNVGRGPTVDLEALCDALESGHLYGAGLDVMEPEPLPSDHRLWRIPNALITPHVAGGLRSPHVLDRVIDISLRNLRAYEAGQPLINLTVAP